MVNLKRISEDLTRVTGPAATIVENLKYLRNPTEGTHSLKTTIISSASLIIADSYHDPITQEFAASLIRGLTEEKSVTAAIKMAESKTKKMQKECGEYDTKALTKIAKSLDLLKKKTQRSGRRFFPPRYTYARAESRALKKITNFIGGKSDVQLLEWATEIKRFLVLSEMVSIVRHRLKDYGASVSDLTDYFLLHFANGQSPPKGGGKYVPKQQPTTKKTRTTKKKRINPVASAPDTSTQTGP